MNTKAWDHKDEWRKRGDNFMVTVTRHSVTQSEFDIGGPNRWAVYAYIYPDHPHFKAFSGDRIWQDATNVMPLHCGCSLLNYPMFDGKVTSVQVGADYQHLHDDFTRFETDSDAWEVFQDANELFEWLQERAK